MTGPPCHRRRPFSGRVTQRRAASVVAAASDVGPLKAQLLDLTAAQPPNNCWFDGALEVLEQINEMVPQEAAPEVWRRFTSPSPQRPPPPPSICFPHPLRRRHRCRPWLARSRP